LDLWIDVHFVNRLAEVWAIASEAKEQPDPFGIAQRDAPAQYSLHLRGPDTAGESEAAQGRAPLRGVELIDRLDDEGAQVGYAGNARASRCA
jgi:hypothetical protein